MGIEVDDPARLGLPALPSGSKDGIHYFHLAKPSSQYSDNHDPDHEDMVRNIRQRKIEAVRERLGGARNGRYGSSTESRGQLGSGLGLGIPGRRGSGRGAKRSISPYPSDMLGSGAGGGGMENPRAMFVRPNEVVFVLGAAE